MVPLNPAQIFLSRSFAQRHCTFWPWLIDWSQYFPSVFPIQKKTPFLKSLLSVWSSMPIFGDLILVTVYGDCIHRPLVWVHCSQVSLRWMMNVFCRRGSWQQSRNPDGTEFNFFKPLYWASGCISTMIERVFGFWQKKEKKEMLLRLPGKHFCLNGWVSTEKRYWFNSTKCPFDLTARERNGKLYQPRPSQHCHRTFSELKI